MSNEALDIQISVNITVPDVLIGVEKTWKEISLEVEKGGSYYPPYTGNYRVRPALYWQQRLETFGKAMEDDVLVDAIPITETSNPHGGKTIVIG